MNPSRPARSIWIFSLCLALLLGALAYEHYQVSQLAASLAAVAGKTDVEAIQARLGRIDERLDAVGDKQFVTADDLQTRLQALSDRLDVAQADASQALEASQHAVSTGDMLALKASVESLDAELQALRESTRKPSPQAINKRALSKSPLWPASKPRARPSPPPPFEIIGVETRGGERFLSVAPPGSQLLSQVLLIRPGDGVSGTGWTLSSLDERTAKFEVAGDSRTLPIHP